MTARWAPDAERALAEQPERCEHRHQAQPGPGEWLWNAPTAARAGRRPGRGDGREATDATWDVSAAPVRS